MADIPLNGPNQNMRDYWEALGHFVHQFAHVEKMLAAVLQHIAGIVGPISQAIFHGVRSEGARQYINRILEVTNHTQAVKDDFTFVFAQLAHITAARNSLLHYGTELNEGTEFISTNQFWALTSDRIKELPVSVDILNQMTADLEKISAHLAVHLVRNWPDAMAGLADRLSRPWQYKPPPQASPGGKLPNKTPAQ